AGAIAAGFFLIPAVGLRATTGVGVLLNVIAAGGAWWLASKARPEKTARLRSSEHSTSFGAASQSPSPKKDKKGAPPSPPPPRFFPGSPGLACAAAGLSGFAALIYEVAWTRLLALVIGPTTYAFATMAAAFISGLAMGSAIGTAIARRAQRPAVWLSAMLAISAITASGAAWVTATRMPLIVAGQVADPSAAFSQVVVAQAFGTALLLLPMTLALGATFPLALAVAGGTPSDVGHEAARVYTANTVGAIAGALVGGFALVPSLGLRLTFQATGVIGALGAAASLVAALRAPNGERRTTKADRRTQNLEQRTPHA